ncbi:glutathione S-transferase C-terminal domain-containing protein [Shewanella dokdonensis]|uniref:glutathione S-transferase C-terminal domain-containing protein n=1 Tax=Shewanella dokdonensis TaxID=712036 RepID=UPI00314055A9
MLWDKKLHTIVNNESADIVRMFNSGFGELASSEFDLYPTALQQEIDALNSYIYPKLNNGVYRAGFATTQVSYQQAYDDVFEALEWLEQQFNDGRRFLLGEQITEADIRLFVTLIRFDVAYHGLFKCNYRQLLSYPQLLNYTKRVLALPGVRDTVNLDHIRRGYYSIKTLNPMGIVPMGPDMSCYGFKDFENE